MIDRDVDLKVGDKTYMLSPTLDAMLKINRALGSPIQALERVRSVDFDAICVIVSAGAGLSAKAAEKLKGEIFVAGVVNMVGPVVQFLAVLLDPSDGKETDSGKA